MRKILNIGFMLMFMALAAGCASKHMTVVDEAARVTAPAPGKALLYFIRDTTYGGAIQAALYDDVKYIGTISARTHVAYQADPGKHLFMVTGESADFMEADLSAGKIYYAYIAPRMGVWKARFSFRPQNGQIEQSAVDRDLKTTKQVAANEAGNAWGAQSTADAKARKDKYFPEWDQKPANMKQILHAESGR